MKKILFVSFIIGLCLSLLSLIKVSGQSPPMVPCAGIGPGCVKGLVINTPKENVIGHRGYPLAMFYLQEDEDGNSTYDGYSVTGIIGDLALYGVIAFGILLSAKTLKQHT